MIHGGKSSEWRVAVFSIWPCTSARSNDKVSDVFQSENNYCKTYLP